ncbi:flagellar hook-length control protein FliK [Bradyrhizobium sp. CSA207]|uniref:flagellar hook-length control protein FliK n=1 Tax=Bradyrhizobium sp. CSA207 TaxID=2698826 RepID=UPI0023B08AF9|nr:flagellar hook-length control protein FliK [Bradyrhizobium sp. CSA207]MDE5442571.1 flagellar hook-length control protein FliK [Bradyrhizobium sp. CSA207]
MTKLNGTSAQLFSGLAESLSVRGTSRAGKNAGGKSSGDAAFNDLLHTVSNLAKRALTDEGSDATVKAAALRTHLVHPAEKGKPKDEGLHERTEAVEELKSSEKSSEDQSPVDQVAKADIQSRSSIPMIVGQDLAAMPAMKPQIQPPAGDKKDTSARDERQSSAKRDVQSVNMAKGAATDLGASAPSGSRPQVAAPQSAAAQEGSDASPRAMPTTPGFEAVTASVERAAKVSARDALPEATKVTVVQQETHLPPAQFSATQQVANAVVSELKGAPAPVASAAPDLTSSQANAPDQPLRILTINLEPPALGNVTVRLRLVGTEVSVQLAAERKDTSQMLDQQRDSIRELMQSAGYVAEVAPVQHGSLDGFQSGSGQSQPQLSGQQQQSPQSQATFDGASTSPGQSDGGAKQARQERQTNQETRHDQDVAPHLRRGPVYL